MSNKFFKFKKFRAQQGFLSIIIAVLLVLMGVISATAVYVLFGSAIGTTDSLLGMRAFYIAEGGLERTQRALENPIFSRRVTCGTITGNAALTNVALGNGTFTVTGNAPNFASSAVQTGLDSTATSIPVSSTASFSVPGRLLIDKEVITYTRLNGNNFLGVKRGVAGTVPANHAFNSQATQYQCTFVSEGGVPSVASSIGDRTLSESAQLQFGVVVGNRTSNTMTASRWNRPTEEAWTNSNFDAGTSRENLNDVSLLSYSDGWAVGNTRNSNYTIARWNGSIWTLVPTTGFDNLFAVSSVSANDAWAAGSGGRIIRWNGTSWISITSPTSQPINSIAMLDATGSGTATIGWGVGNNGTLLRYGGTWSVITSPTTQTLNHVVIVSANEAWAVGNSGVIIRWNGSNWSLYQDVGNVNLASISMVDTNNDGVANDGWAVGPGVAYRYVGGTWVSQTASSINTPTSVAAFAGDDVWVCGNNTSCAHWDGSAWTNIATGIGVANINAISIIRPNSPRSNWQEIFP